MDYNQRQKAIILLVEDDEDDQISTERALKKSPLHTELRIVEDGEEALDYLRGRGEFSAPGSAPRPSLILLDLNLPKVDGREVLEAIQGDSDLKQIPVVVLTTSRSSEDVLSTYGLGCNSFISKPVSAEQFSETIQALGRYWLEVAILPER